MWLLLSFHWNWYHDQINQQKVISRPLIPGQKRAWKLHNQENPESSPDQTISTEATDPETTFVSTSCATEVSSDLANSTINITIDDQQPKRGTFLKKGINFGSLAGVNQRLESKVSYEGLHLIIAGKSLDLNHRVGKWGIKDKKFVKFFDFSDFSENLGKVAPK